MTCAEVCAAPVTSTVLATVTTDGVLSVADGVVTRVVEEGLETVLALETIGFKPSFQIANAVEPPPRNRHKYAICKKKSGSKAEEILTCVLRVPRAAGVAIAVRHLLTGRWNSITTPAVGAVRKAKDRLVLSDTPGLTPSHGLISVQPLIGESITDREAAFVCRGVQGESSPWIALGLLFLCHDRGEDEYERKECQECRWDYGPHPVPIYRG